MYPRLSCQQPIADCENQYMTSIDHAAMLVGREKGLEGITLEWNLIIIYYAAREALSIFRSNGGSS